MDMISALVLLAKGVAVLLVFVTAPLIFILAERKILGRIQSRIGPNRVGPWGTLQTLADGIKLGTKEDIIPAGADRLIFWIAPLFMVVPALTAWALIPFGPMVNLGRETGLWVANLNVGILLILALGSLNAYGPVMSGWASNSKYAHFGALRAGAQIISYELTLGLAVLAVIVYSGSFSLVDIVESQRHMWLVVPQFLGFVIFIISGVAETNRAPFDLPEAETEIVAGYFVEYTGIRFAMFFVAEYANMFLMSMLVTVLYLGGWNGFTIPGLEGLSGVAWTLAKALTLMFGYFWLRGTLPRLRYDQLMAFCWKILLPLGVLNLFVAAILRMVWS
jgi:NADH-quinone oxidoreductase subunit H